MHGALKPLIIKRRGGAKTPKIYKFKARPLGPFCGTGLNLLKSRAQCWQSTRYDVLRVAIRLTTPSRYSLPWQCLNFLPDPQGQASLRPGLPQVARSFSSKAPGTVGVTSIDCAAAAMAACCRAISSIIAFCSSAERIRTCAKSWVTRSRKPSSRFWNNWKASDLYSLSGSRCA